MAKQELTCDDILKELRAKQYRPIYYLMGEESYYIDLIADYITDNVLSETEKEFNLTVVYGADVDVATIINAAKRYPMMSEHQVVVVKEAQAVRNMEELSYYLQKPLLSTILVICHKHGTLDRRKKLAAEVDKVGVLFESKKIKDAQLPGFIASYMKRKGVDMEPKATVMLADFVGSDLSRLTGELEKLIITLPAGQNRPIFATVLALLIVVAGLVTLNILPVAQFPEITPPTVQVSAVYPGANAETVAQTVGIPIEQQVNGVDGMLYMSSNSSSSGAYSLTITFAVGTDIDMATVQVQNMVSIAQSSLPEPVVVQGVTVQKQSSNIVMFLTMTSQDSVYNSLYLTNYAKLNLVDQLTRVPGVGAVNVMGAGDYSMRVWLDPEAMRIRNISPQQVYQAIQSQNAEVSAGYIGQPIGQDNKNAFQYTLNVQGRLNSPEQFGDIIIRQERRGDGNLKILRIDLGSANTA